MQSKEHVIVGLLTSWNPIFQIFIAWVLAGGLWLFLTVAMSGVSRVKPQWSSNLEAATGRVLAGCLGIFLIVFCAMYYVGTFSDPKVEAKKILALAKLPPEKRMLLIENYGRITISERASLFNPQGELIVFQRNNVQMQIPTFVKVWDLAGGSPIKVEAAGAALSP